MASAEQVRTAIPAGPGPADALAGPAPAGEIIPRVVSASLEASLERFSDRTLLAAGKVNLISLEAVQKRLGARWSLRQDQVYDFAARVIERGVGARGLSVRVSGSDFLVVQPELNRLAAQAACLRYLREILNHFLGDAHLAGVGVLQVTRIAGANLEAKPMDVRASDVADREEAILSGAADPVAPSARDTGSESPGAAAGGGAPVQIAGHAEPARQSEGQVVDRWSPFVANDGRQLRVSASLEPVFELKGFSRIGFRMIRRVVVTRTQEELAPVAVSNLSAADLLRVDLATIARGIDRLQHDGAGESQLSLIVPLSYASLASQRGRAELVPPLREAGRLVRCGVICEICDIEGVPSSALLSAVSLIQPFALLVVGRLLTPTPAVMGPLKGTGLRGLSFECPPDLSDGEFVAWAGPAIHAAKRIARSAMIYQAASERRAGELGLLGATHVSIAREAAG
ncbi:MAG TPA: hypothetical protein VLI41_08840 [Phenylobacterium sp.]|uniref:hypothetical protein n=1 Tax=Phenylobacterium sp. TaxID=1871053 RepID=UPI002B95067F|nr:hypothetical protein [Phenylobacterium sp.]HSV03299.1 hypothetical protein [Phenylobacterium sp.]